MAERIEEFCYTKKDFEIEWFSGSGKGGQNRNKVQCCCRVTHKQSGLQGLGTEQRTRNQNFKTAFQRLGEKLKPWIEEQVKAKRPEKKLETIRSYNIVDNRVVDHDTGETKSWSEIERDLGDMVENRKKDVHGS